MARLFDGPPASSGVPVNEWNALSYSAVWSAVGQISSTVASLPLKLYKRLPDGGKEPFAGHKLYELLHDNPNPEMTSFIFREILQAHLLTWGNGYAEVERDFAGRPVALWPIPPDRVDPFRDDRDRLVYRVRSGGRLPDAVIPASDMLHIPGLGFDGMKGYSVIQMARESLGLGLAAERFGGTFFGGGSTFGGFLTHPAKLSPEARQNLTDSLAKHSGHTRAHRILLLQENMSFVERKGVPPNDAQFLETRTFQIQEVARWFKISPYKLGDLSHATFSNIEHQAIEYLTDTIRPWLVRWEQEINRKLIAPLERRQQFVEFSIEGALRGDVASRYSAYAVGRQWGWLSADDVRALENMNPLPKGQGGIYLLPQNMVPADRINEIIDKQVEPDPEPVAPQPVAGPSEEQTNSLRRVVELVEARVPELTAEAEAARAAEREAREALAASACETVELRATLAAAEARAGAAAEEQADRVKRAVELLEARIPELTTESEEARAAAAQAREDLAAAGGLSVELRAEKDAAEARSAAADQARLEALTALALATEAKDRLEARAVEAEREREALDLQREGLEVALESAISGQDRAARERDAAEAARAEAEAAIAEAQAASTAALAERDAARERLAADTGTWTASRAELQGNLVTAQSALMAAEASLAAATEAEALRAAEVETIAAQHAEAVAAVGSLTARLAETAGMLAERDGDVIALTGDLAAVVDREAEQAAEARAVAERQAQAERELTEARDRALAEALEAAAALVERDKLAAQQAAALAEAKAREEWLLSERQLEDNKRTLESSAAEARDRALAEAQETAAKLSAGRGALVSAHRSLYQDAMTRLLEREIDRIIGARSSVNKLRTVMGPFYDRHLELVTRDLVPLLRVHVAFLRRDEDPEALAADLAEQHIALSKADLAEVYEADADEFPTQLSRMIQRWRDKRTSDLAEYLMRREIEHG